MLKHATAREELLDWVWRTQVGLMRRLVRRGRATRAYGTSTSSTTSARLFHSVESEILLFWKASEAVNICEHV